MRVTPGDSPTTRGRRFFEKKDFYWMTLFEGLLSLAAGLSDDSSGWFRETAGAVTIGSDSTGLLVALAGIVGDYGIVRKSCIGSPVTMSWAKKRSIRTRVVHDAINQIETFVLSGWPGTTHHVGFRLTETGRILGTVADGAVEATLDLQGFAANVRYELEARFYPAVRCDFYVNETFRGSVTSNLPTGTTLAESLFELQPYQRAAAGGIVRVYFYELYQEA